eukprot:gene12350-14587_t
MRNPTCDESPESTEMMAAWQHFNNQSTIIGALNSASAGLVNQHREEHTKDQNSMPSSKMRDDAASESRLPTGRTWKPSDGPRKIEVSITVQSVENICTTEETVEVGMLLDVFWLATIEELKAQGSEGSSWGFHGNFQTVNAIVDNEREVRKEPQLKYVRDEMKWYAQVWISSKFKQSFDIRHFPFDSQQLVVRFEMGNMKDMRYVPPEGQGTVCSIERELCPCSDWTWRGASVVMTGTDPALSKQGNSYAQLIVVFHLARVWEPYFYRIGVFVILLIWSSITPFVLDPIEDYADRMGIVWTILLTQVAFQLTIQGSLPMARHMSLLEVLVMVSIVFIFLVAFETSLVKGVHYKFSKDWTALDDISFIVHSVSVVLFHIFGAWYCYSVRISTSQKNKQDPCVWTGKPQKNIQVQSQATGSTRSIDDSTMVYSSVM